MLKKTLGKCLIKDSSKLTKTVSTKLLRIRKREFLNQSNKKNQGNMMADDFEDA